MTGGTSRENEVTIVLTISDPRLDDDEREDVVQRLYRQLREGETHFGAVTRPRVPAPEGAKSIASTLIGVLTATLSAGALKAFFDYLAERWRGHEVTIAVETKQHTIKITARRPEDLVVAYNAAAALAASPQASAPKEE